MQQTCHFCHEPITRHESTVGVMDWDGPTRTYHRGCHRLDLYEHRDRDERLPEDQPLERST